MNDSSTGGYLAPGTAHPPLEDAALDSFLQKILVGLTGIAGNLVRPRWQPVPPNQTDIDTNWVAFGITSRPADTFAFETHDPNAANGNGADIVNRNEQLDILCSFFGPQAGGYAARVRDGLAVPQNREALQLAGMALIECTDLITAPALVNQQWYYRVDMTVRIRRAVTRVYPILHLRSAGIVLHTDVGITENIETQENPMSIGLPVSRLINVSVNLTPLGAQYANFNSLLLMGSSNVIDTFERIRTYNDLASVASDFGTSAPEYLAASLFFGQSPQPTVLTIGRWAQASTSGLLRGGVLTAAQQLLSAWTSITNGGVNFTINGTPRNLTGLNFSGASNMNGVASIINTALGVNGTCVWNGSQFIVSSATTGTASTVALATAGAGTDISAQLKLTAGTASYVVAGVAAESAAAAVAALDNLSTTWYALTVVAAGAVAADHLAIAAYIQGANTKHLYGITSQDTAALLTTDSTSIGYQMKQLGYTRVCTQYSSSNPYAICSLFGRILTVDFTANNSVITLMYKQEPGVAPEGLSASQVTALELNYYNYFAQYNNNTAIIANGQMASGNYFDEVYGTDWLANAIQTDIYNLLYQSPTKIPQTDPGTHLLVTAAEAACGGGVTNGLLAPGIWNSQGFGELTQGALLSKGYYVYAQPVATQSAADRAARKSVPIQIAAKLAGAIHKSNILINVNR